jgi:transposase
VKEWLVRVPRFHFHFIPISSSWLNAVERFFAELTQKRLRLGVFRSFLDLIEAIDATWKSRTSNPNPLSGQKRMRKLLCPGGGLKSY